MRGGVVKQGLWVKKREGSGELRGNDRRGRFPTSLEMIRSRLLGGRKWSAIKKRKRLRDQRELIVLWPTGRGQRGTEKKK